MSEIPMDVKPVWFKLIRRIQSVASKNHGLAVVKLSIVVNEKGEPIWWIEPNITLIEPLHVDRQAVLDLLTD